MTLKLLYRLIDSPKVRQSPLLHLLLGLGSLNPSQVKRGRHVCVVPLVQAAGGGHLRRDGGEDAEAHPGVAGGRGRGGPRAARFGIISYRPWH